MCFGNTSVHATRAGPRRDRLGRPAFGCVRAWGNLVRNPDWQATIRRRRCPGGLATGRCWGPFRVPGTAERVWCRQGVGRTLSAVPDGGPDGPAGERGGGGCGGGGVPNWDRVAIAARRVGAGSGRSTGERGGEHAAGDRGEGCRAEAEATLAVRNDGGGGSLVAAAGVVGWLLDHEAGKERAREIERQAEGFRRHVEEADRVRKEQEQSETNSIAIESLLKEGAAALRGEDPRRAEVVLAAAQRRATDPGGERFQDRSSESSVPS